MAIVSTKANEDGTERYVLMTGYVTREPKIATTAKGFPKVQFGFCYDSKKFHNVLCIGDDAVSRVASQLQVHDVLLIGGKWSSRQYTTKDGEQKTWTEVKADFILPQVDVAMTASSPAQGNESAPQAVAADIEMDTEYDLPFD